ncbi:MAG TPA: glycosyltransferase [Rhodothermales bacterium]
MSERIPMIAGVEPRLPRPRWSVMIPTYNCAHYLPESLTSVLTQARGSDAMQIEVVDDGSTDGPQLVAERMAGGRVDYFQQPTNVGVAANLTTCIRRARGELVHILHGDDAVRPGFYAAMEHAFAERPDLGAAFSRQIFMDERGHWQALSPLERESSGVLDDAASYLATEQRIMTPSICVPRSVYERLGGFHEDLRCTEDWEMWVRIAASYPIWYEVQPLALYRVHDVSNTGRHVRTGDDVRDTAKAIDLIAQHLPPRIAPRIASKARQTYALSALTTARKSLHRGDVGTARAQVTGALRLSRSARVVAAAAKTLVDALMLWVSPRDRAGQTDRNRSSSGRG